MTPDSSATGSLVIHSARLVDDGAIVDDAWVRIERGRIAARGVGDTWTPAEQVIDATAVAGPAAVLTPGFIDIHGHGGAGASFDDGVEAIRTARALHRQHGTTRAVVSLVTAPLDDLALRVGEIADLMQTDADILGSHLEGPFLDPAHHGAHEPALLREPDPADVARVEAELTSLGSERIVDLTAIANILGLDVYEVADLDREIMPRGVRALSLVPHLSWNAIKAVSAHFTTLPQLRAASVADIEVIDGVGHYRAQLIVENLAHQAQAVGAGVVGW